MGGGGGEGGGWGVVGVCVEGVQDKKGTITLLKKPK